MPKYYSGMTYVTNAYAGNVHRFLLFGTCEPSTKYNGFEVKISYKRTCQVESASVPDLNKIKEIESIKEELALVKSKKRTRKVA